MAAKFLQDHTTGNLINLDKVARFEQRQRGLGGLYAAVDADGKELGKFHDFDVFPLADRGTVVPSRPGNRAVVLCDWTSGRLENPDDIKVLEYDVVGWRIIDWMAYPVFIKELTTHQRALIKMPDGQLFDTDDLEIKTVEEAKDRFIQQRQRDFDSDAARRAAGTKVN